MTVVSPLSHLACVELVATVPVGPLCSLWKKSGVDVSAFFAKGDDINLYQCQDSGLLFCDPLSSGDGGFYDQITASESYYNVEKTEFKAIGKIVAAGEKVLDVGSGEGWLSTYLNGADYQGLELSPSSCGRAAKLGHRVSNEGVLEHAKAHPEEYDCVMTCQVLEHVSNPLSFLRGCVDALKPGGKLIVSVPDNSGFLSHYPNNCLNLPPHHVTWWTDQSLDYIFRAVGVDSPIIYRESAVASDHVDILTTIVASSLSLRLFNKPSPKIIVSGQDRMVWKIAKMIAKMIARKMPSDMTPFIGHTLLAVARKAVPA